MTPLDSPIPPDPWDVSPSGPRWQNLADPRVLVWHARSYRRQRGLPWDDEWPRYTGRGLYVPAKGAPSLTVAGAIVSLGKTIRDRTAWWYPCYCAGGPGLWSYRDSPPFDLAACTCRGYERASSKVAAAYAEVVQLAGWDPPPMRWPLPALTGDPEAVRKALAALVGSLTDPDRVRGRAVTRGARKGGLTTKEREKRVEYRVLREAWARMQEQRPDGGFDAVDRAVARAHEVSARTVRRARAAK